MLLLLLKLNPGYIRRMSFVKFLTSFRLFKKMPMASGIIDTMIDRCSISEQFHIVAISWSSTQRRSNDYSSYYWQIDILGHYRSIVVRSLLNGTSWIVTGGHSTAWLLLVRAQDLKMKARRAPYPTITNALNGLHDNQLPVYKQFRSTDFKPQISHWGVIFQVGTPPSWGMPTKTTSLRV